MEEKARRRCWHGWVDGEANLKMKADEVIGTAMRWRDIVGWVFFWYAMLLLFKDGRRTWSEMVSSDICTYVNNNNN